MTMKFLSATTDTKGYHYSVWLDTAKGTAESPDHSYVRNYDWAAAPTNWEGGTSAYQQMTLDEVKLLAQADLNAINTPTPATTNLSVQGQTF